MNLLDGILYRIDFLLTDPINGFQRVYDAPGAITDGKANRNLGGEAAL